MVIKHISGLSCQACAHAGAVLQGHFLCGKPKLTAMLLAHGLYPHLTVGGWMVEVELERLPNSVKRQLQEVNR